MLKDIILDTKQLHEQRNDQGEGCSHTNKTRLKDNGLKLSSAATTRLPWS